MSRVQIEKDILRRIQNIGQFSSKAIRAPHKPLLLLLAVSKAAAGEERRIYFSDVEGAFVSPASRSRHLLPPSRCYCRNQATAGSVLVQWEAPARGDPMLDINEWSRFVW